MAASTVSSALITNRRATPPTYNDVMSGVASNKDGTIMGTIEVATTSMDDVGDIIVLCDLLGSDRIKSIKLFTDALDTHSTPTLSYDLGLYKNTTAAGTGSTVVSATAYGTAITVVQAGSKVGVEEMCEARDIAKIGKANQTVAVDGGESEHSDMRQLALTCTATAATAAAGTVSFIVEVIHQ